MEAQDEHLTESWKSEMDNLLIFVSLHHTHPISETNSSTKATLYSAIVTAFLIESFKLVSPEAAAADNTLAEISSRIASFSFSNNFANSTHVLAGTTTTTPPPSYAVKINTIWFLSLNLSLIAAFFGIAIQQWLRHLRIPKHIPPREAIRLRQLRYRGLMKWQVPIIVTILPALVQISVVLFLIGLIQYVRHSNQDVALPFTVVSSLSLVLFVIVSLFPLVEPSCPYKSPLVHIIWNLGWMVAAITTVAITLPTSLIVDCFATKKHATLSRWANNINTFATQYLLALQPPTNETNHFWTARETATAEREKTKQLLDQEALSWALTAGPKIKDIRCCLSDLIPQHRTRCVMEWISLKYDGHTDMARMLSKGTLSKRVLLKVTTLFSLEFKDLLMDVLTSSDWTAKPRSRARDSDIPYMAMFLWRILKVESDPEAKDVDAEALDQFRKEFIRQLSVICIERTPDKEADQSFLGWKVTPRILPVLLFDLLDTEKDDILFGDDGESRAIVEMYDLLIKDRSPDIVSVLKWAEQTAGILTEAQSDKEHAAPMFWFAPHEHILSCCAIAFSLLASHKSLTPDVKQACQASLKELLQHLIDFLRRGNIVIPVLLGRYDKLNDTESETLPLVMRTAVPMIAKSIAQLRENKVLPLSSNDCPSDAVQVQMKIVYAEFLNQDLNEKSARAREGTMDISPNIEGVAVVSLLGLTSVTVTHDFGCLSSRKKVVRARETRARNRYICCTSFLLPYESRFPPSSPSCQSQRNCYVSLGLNPSNYCTTWDISLLYLYDTSLL